MSESLDQRASRFETQALASSVTGAQLESKLREAVASRFENSPISQQRESALQNVLTSPTRSREQIAETVRGGTILSPTQQQSIESAQFASDIVPLISLNDLLERQFGGIDTAVKSGVDAFSALNAGRQGQAQLARTQADSSFNRNIQLRQLALQEHKAGLGSGGGLSGLLGSLTSKEGSDLSEGVTGLSRLNSLIKQLGEAGVTSGGGLGLFGRGSNITGPIAGRTSFGSESDRALRQEIGLLADDIRRRKFGTAFTAAEQAVGTLPAKSKQERTNLDILQQLRDSAEREINTQLRTLGVTDPNQIELTKLLLSGGESGGGEWELVN